MSSSEDTTPPMSEKPLSAHSSASRKSDGTHRSKSSVHSEAAKARAEAAAFAAEASVRKRRAAIELERAMYDQMDQVAAAEQIRQKAELEAEQTIRAAASARKKLEFETNIEILRQEEKIVAAVARAEMLENEIKITSKGGTSSKGSLSVNSVEKLPKMNPAQRVKEYVVDQSRTLADVGHENHPEATSQGQHDTDTNVKEQANTAFNDHIQFSQAGNAHTAQESLGPQHVQNSNMSHYAPIHPQHVSHYAPTQPQHAGHYAQSTHSQHASHYAPTQVPQHAGHYAPTQTQHVSHYAPMQPQHASHYDVPTESHRASHYIPTESQHASHYVPTESHHASHYVPTESRHDSHYVPAQSQHASYPSRPHPQPSRFDDDMTPVIGWFEYFARKDLVTQGLTEFDDCPENFRAWRLSFKNATKNVRLTPSEEMDLLVKWTGPTSRDTAKKIRSVHINDPASGLRQVWERLEETFGRPEVITNALLKNLKDFPKIAAKESKKLRDLSDILYMLKSAKEEKNLPGLSYLDTYIGVNEIVQKLPYNLQEKWRSKGREYKERNNVPFPPFEFFATFVRKMGDERNDPSFDFSTFDGAITGSVREKKQYGRPEGTGGIVSRKTEIHVNKDGGSSSYRKLDPSKECPIHKKPHPLTKCRSFREKTWEERKKVIQSHGICFKCCASTNHIFRDCTSKVKCSECGSEKHVSALHNDSRYPRGQSKDGEENGGEKPPNNSPADIRNDTSTDVNANCSDICGVGFSGKSCAKICLAKIYTAGRPDKAKKVYVLLDEQSNKSLAKTELFEQLHVGGHPSPYTLRTCSGLVHTTGRRAKDLVIESLDGKTTLPLPTIIECNEIPESRAEIPTPTAAKHFAHLRPIADHIPEIDDQAQILILLGRDILQVHKVREHRNGPGNTPFAQRLDLGWVIIGEVCLDGSHKPDDIYSCKTYIHDNGRPSMLCPCPNKMMIKQPSSELMESNTKQSVQSNPINTLDEDEPRFQKRKETFIDGKFDDGLGHDIFKRTNYDNKPGPSIEDMKFLSIMNKDMVKNASHSWVAPLPFKVPRPRLPDNKDMASKRFLALQRSLEKKPVMKEHYFSFMGALFKNGHAERAPPLAVGKECWFLPHFGVYHPRKPQKIRVVFDSSAQYGGVSLNSILLSGPDLMNSLLGVLLRFRHGPIAFIADIEQMFHSFAVKIEHRDFLRFLWYENNDPNAKIVEYRMTVHLFGNSPSPAVATCGLRKTAEEGEEKYGSEARKFVERNFYVDDGLKSVPTADEAINLLRGTQNMLSTANLRLHKIASNSPEVMKAFPKNDHAGSFKNLDLSHDALPMQQSLGVCWDIEMDTFTFRVSHVEKPYTKRGLLSVINSLYDPLGFAAPVTIEGKFILRKMLALKSQSAVEWDDPLPVDKKVEWDRWRESLQSLSSVHIPRPYSQTSLNDAKQKELHVFADSSEIAIAASVYLQLITSEGETQVSFVIGKSKLAPTHATTIPRLELCAAVLAVELFELVREEIDIELDTVTFYSDSRVVMGYITNETRRFYTYVSNRVARIRQSSEPNQWVYVPTEINPADHATRPVAAADLHNTSWLTGPAFLTGNHKPRTDASEVVVDSACDPEVRPEVSTLHTEVETNTPLKPGRFERFSTWRRLLHAVGNLVHIARSHSHKANGNQDSCHGWHNCKMFPSVAELAAAQHVVIQSVQSEAFPLELSCLKSRRPIPKTSTICGLNPFIDTDGLIRVGGRLSHSGLPAEEQKPLIIPGKCHIAILLVRHFHVSVRHQGRHFTHGALRAGGFWIQGAKRLINNIIHKCVNCCKLRGNQATQQMADLPAERLTTDPPFTNVGLDVFGPWYVVARRTRGGQANSKRWAILFTCMAVRAIHIEIIDEMDASTTINALRRFLAIRGPVRKFRSDNGTNFTGCCNLLGQVMPEKDVDYVKKVLIDEGCTWEFNPPHSSHMGGVWERMIGVVRRILDSMFRDLGPTQLTHDVLVTLMAEVSAIVNARPLVPVSSDPEAPEILTPNMLLTQKVAMCPTAPPGIFDKKDLFRRQWRRVQYLANVFWARWRKEYLPLLQVRKKWQNKEDNMCVGDLVLVREKELKRNEWPVGRIIKVLPSEDGKVRKVDVNIARNKTVKTFRRPISELVLLLREE